MSASALEDCIAACNACADACDHCSTACLAEPEVDAMRQCIALDIDCASLCRLAAAMMARGSDFAGPICALCAELCEACGRACSVHEAEHCRRCAEACHACAGACRSMSIGS